MEFHSEWLLEDPIEVLSEINKEVYSKDEIEKLSTKENLSEIDKAYLLLENGQISQKLWVVRNLHNIMHEGRFHEIMAELINRLPYWNEAGQEEAGKALVKIISNSCFPLKYAEHLLNLSLQIIDSETWTLQKTWGDVISELSKKVPEKLLARCMQEALSLSSFNQKDQTRSVGGVILGAIVEARKKPPGEITRKILLMSQDPSNFVRMNMCSSLRTLFKLSRDYEEKVVDEIIKLVGDECVEVLQESLQLFVDVLPDVRNKEYVLDNIQEHFVRSRYDKLTEIKLKFVGRIMKLLMDFMNPQMKDAWVQWVLQMNGDGGLAEKKSSSLSLGGILQCAGLDDKTFGLWSLLFEENDLEIHKNLLVQFGFLTTLAGNKIQELQRIAKQLIKNQEFLNLLIPQFTVIARNLSMQDEMVQILIENLSSKLKLRETLTVFDQLIAFINEFHCINPLKAITPMLIDIAKTASLPVKEKSLELLSIILYNSPGFSNKITLSREIISNFANSTVCYNRCAYIYFCLCIRKLCSKQFFSKVFMNSLISLARDRAHVVKYSFAKHYATFRYLIPAADTDLTANFRCILNEFLEIDDKILVNYALAADEELNNTQLYQQNYGPAGESVENSRIKQEQEEETKEIIERESLKKIQNEENLQVTRKFNKKFPNTYKEPVRRESSVKPIKKYHLSETDRNDIGLNRTMIRNGKKKLCK